MKNNRKKNRKRNKSKIKRPQKRLQRLQIAPLWLLTIDYTGSQLVHAYSKKFNTDLLCSIKELRMLGIEISANYEEAVARSLSNRIEQKRQKKAESDIMEESWTDANFAYIVGYTSGGAPYGISWEELDELE